MTLQTSLNRGLYMVLSWFINFFNLSKTWQKFNFPHSLQTSATNLAVQFFQKIARAHTSETKYHQPTRAQSHKVIHAQDLQDSLKAGVDWPPTSVVNGTMRPRPIPKLINLVKSTTYQEHSYTNHLIIHYSWSVAPLSQSLQSHRA